MSNKTSTFFKGMSVQTLITVVMGVLEIVEFALYTRLVYNHGISHGRKSTSKARTKMIINQD